MSSSENSLLAEIYALLGDSQQFNFRDLLEQKKIEYGISSDIQLSQIIGIDRTTLSRMVKGEVQKVDIQSFLKLDRFLGIGITKLIQIYVAALNPELIGELERTSRATFIVKNFDLKGLKAIGLLDNVNDFGYIESRINGFFGLNTIFDYEHMAGPALFSRTKAKSIDKMREFWVRSAIYQFEKINNPHDYHREDLMKLVPKMRSYTRFEKDGFVTVIRALYHAGVTVIVQPYVKNAQVRGGTFIVDDKPCIALTDYRKSYDTLWFTLLHELYHVLYDFDRLKGWKFHLSGEVDLTLSLEAEADEFAQQMLFPKEKLDFIRPLINLPANVEAYAESCSVHPSIIYGFHCWHEYQKGRNVYGAFKHLVSTSGLAVKGLNDNPFEKSTLAETLNTYKQKLKLV